MTGSVGEEREGQKLCGLPGDPRSNDKEKNYRNLKCVNVKEAEFETALGYIHIQIWSMNLNLAHAVLMVTAEWCSVTASSDLSLWRNESQALWILRKQYYSSHPSNSRCTLAYICIYIYIQSFLILYPLETVLTKPGGSTQPKSFSVRSNYFHGHSFDRLTFLYLPSGLFGRGLTIKIPYDVLASKFLTHAQITTVS